MGSRTGSHQLSNGLIVSGRPEQLKERQPTMGSRAVPYTGGDVKKSGELGKMYGVGDYPGPPPILKPSSRGSSASQHNSGSVRSGPNSGPVSHKLSNSGSMPKKSSGSFSGQLMTPIQPTGLITSGPLSSNIGRRSGQLEPAGSFKKVVYGSSVTSLNDEMKMGFRVSKVAMWVFLVVVLMGLVVGGFLMVAVKKAIILVAVGGVVAPLVVILLWNFAYKERGLLGYLKRYPDAELRGAIDGQFVKVTGVISHPYSNFAYISPQLAFLLFPRFDLIRSLSKKFLNLVISN